METSRQSYSHPYAFPANPSVLPPTQTAPLSLPPARALPPLPSSPPNPSPAPYPSPAGYARQSRTESSPTSSVHPLASSSSSSAAGEQGAWRSAQPDREQPRRRGASTTSSSSYQDGPGTPPESADGSPLSNGARRHPTRPSRPGSSTSQTPSTSTAATSHENGPSAMAPVSSRTVLTIALQKAQSAVLLDGANNVPAAIVAYGESVRLLKEVMARVDEISRRQRDKERLRERDRDRDGGTEEDRLRRLARREQHEQAKEDEAKRLRIIHDTYEDRIRMLLQNEAELSSSSPSSATAYPSPSTHSSPSTPRAFSTTTSPPITPRSQQLAFSSQQPHSAAASQRRYHQNDSPTTTDSTAVFPTPMPAASPPPSPMDPMMLGIEQQQRAATAAALLHHGPPRKAADVFSVENGAPFTMPPQEQQKEPTHAGTRSVASSTPTTRRPSSTISEGVNEPAEAVRNGRIAHWDLDGKKEKREVNEPGEPPKQDQEGEQGEEPPNEDLPEMAGYSSRVLDEREPISSSEDDERVPVTAYEYAGWPNRPPPATTEDDDPYDGLAAQSPSSAALGPTPALPPNHARPALPVGGVLDRPRPRPSRSASLAAPGGVRESQVGTTIPKTLVSASTSQGTISQRRRSPVNQLSLGSQGGNEFWQNSNDIKPVAEEEQVLKVPRGIVVRPASAEVASDFGQLPTPPSSYSSGSLPARLRTLSQPGKRPSLGTFESAPALPRLNVNLPPTDHLPSFSRKNSVPTPTTLAPSLDRSLSLSSTGSTSEREPGRTPSPYRTSSALSEDTPVSATFGRRLPSASQTGHGTAFLAPPPPFEYPTTPVVPIRRPFHLMRQILTTIETGGYVTPKLYIPKVMWGQSGVKLVAVETKVRMLDHLLTGLDALDKAGDGLLYSGRGLGSSVQSLQRFMRELEVFEGLSDGIQSTLAKKLGYGTSGKKTSATSFSAWSSKLSRSLDRVTNGRSLDSPATYVEGIARVFRQSQGIDRHLVALNDGSGGYGALSADQLRGIEQRLRRVSDFFGQVICQFVLRDVGILLDKFVKRGGSWVGSE